jgi:hypothetical protein
MSASLDIAKLESTVDFESVSKKLDALAASGTFRRRKSVTDLLDKMKPSLVRARENKVPLRTLAAFLKDSGIPVSEPTLRRYMNALPDAKKSRRQPSKRPVKKVAPAPEPPASPEAAKKKLPPRLARRATS